MGQRTNLLLQIEGRSGARLNRVYHLQWGYRKKLPMAFLHLLSSRYFRPDGTDVFAFFSNVLKLEGESAFSRWVSTEEFMQHQPQYDEKYDDIFAHAFDALTTLYGTLHFVHQLS